MKKQEEEQNQDEYTQAEYIQWVRKHGKPPDNAPPVHRDIGSGEPSHRDAGRDKPTYREKVLEKERKRKEWRKRNAKREIE